MPELTVSSIRSRRDFDAFIKLPWKLYANDPQWVPPLLMERKAFFDRTKNPFFEHAEAEYFLAWRDGEPVGRIAAILNEAHNRFHEEEIGFFGGFETVRDPDVSTILFEAAEAWCGDRNLTAVRGPTTLSVNDECGLLVEGFDEPPVILTAYNPPWYEELIGDSGYRPIKELLAYQRESRGEIPERLEQMAKKVMDRGGVTLRTINMDRLYEEAELIRGIFNAAWSRNWGFVPLSDAEIEHVAKEMKPILIPDLVFIAEVDGEPAGFSITIPDMNQALIHLNGRLLPFGLFKLLWHRRKIDTCRIALLGVKPEFQPRGLGALLYYQTFKNGPGHGFTRGEMSWILEENVLMRRALEMVGAEVYKRYRLYEKNL